MADDWANLEFWQSGAGIGREIQFSFRCGTCGALVVGVVWVPTGGTGEVRGFPCPGCPATYTVERTDS